MLSPSVGEALASTSAVQPRDGGGIALRDGPFGPDTIQQPLAAQPLDQLLQRGRVCPAAMLGIRLQAAPVPAEGGRQREVPEQPLLRAGVGGCIERQSQPEPSEQLHQRGLARARQAELAQMPHHARQGGGVVEGVMRSAAGAPRTGGRVRKARALSSINERASGSVSKNTSSSSPGRPSASRRSTGTSKVWPLWATRRSPPTNSRNAGQTSATVGWSQTSASL